MKLLVCAECGKAYEGERRDSPCPRCAAIDLLMPAGDRHETPVVGVPHVVPKARADAAKYSPPATEAPPPVAIPGPASTLANTLQDTRHEPPIPPLSHPADDLDLGGLDRFAAPRGRDDFGMGELDRPIAADELPPEDTDCPRCAERIKIKAKMCRFCGLELSRPDRTHDFKRPARVERVGRVEIERAPRRDDRPYGQCRCGAWMDEVVPGWAIALAILMFPLGLLFLIVKEKRCHRCNPSAPIGGWVVAAIFMVAVAIGLLVVWLSTR